MIMIEFEWMKHYTSVLMFRLKSYVRYILCKVQGNEFYRMIAMFKAVDHSTEDFIEVSHETFQRILRFLSILAHVAQYVPFVH